MRNGNKKIFSLLTAMAVSTSCFVSVSAKSTVVSETSTILNDTFENFDLGVVTDINNMLGYNIADTSNTNPKAGYGTVSIANVKDHFDGASDEQTTQALEITLTKDQQFSLVKLFDVEGNPDKIDVSFWYKSDKKIGFNPLGSIFGNDCDFSHPVLNGDGWDSVGNGIVGYFGFEQWNRVDCNIDYTTGKAKASFDTTWSTGGYITSEYDIDASKLPQMLTWSTDCNSLQDGETAKFYLDNVSIKAEYSHTEFDKPSTSNTFFDTTDGNAKAVTSYSNNVYTCDTINTTPLNRTEIPTEVDYIGYKFDYENATPGSAKLIVAQYTNAELPELQGMTVDDVTLDAESGSVYTKTPLHLQNGTMIQAFLWYDFNQILPVTSSPVAEKVSESSTTPIVTLDFEDCIRADNGSMWAYNEADNTFIKDDGTVTTTSGEYNKGFANWAVTNATGTPIVANGDASNWTTAIIPGESTKIGNNSLRVYIDSSIPESSFATANENETVKNELLSEFKNAKPSANYKLSFYARATQADANITVRLRNDLQDGSNPDRWIKYPIAANLTVKKGDWQHFVVYFNIGSEGDDYWTSKFEQLNYNMLETVMTSTVSQPLYFDNIKIERVN